MLGTPFSGKAVPKPSVKPFCSFADSAGRPGTSIVDACTKAACEIRKKIQKFWEGAWGSPFFKRVAPTSFDKTVMHLTSLSLAHGGPSAGGQFQGGEGEGGGELGTVLPAGGGGRAAPRAIAILPFQ